MTKEMCLTRKFIFLIFIFIFILSFGLLACSSQEQEVKEDIEKEVQAESTLEESVDLAEGKKEEREEIAESNSGEETSKPEEIQILNQTPPLTLDPQSAIEDDTLDHLRRLPMLHPFYRDDYRILFRSSKNTTNGAQSTFEFANISDKPITLTDDDIRYVAFSMGGEDIAKSRLEGAPVTIQPNEIKTITLTAQHPRAVAVHLYYDGVDMAFSTGSFIYELIEDTEPRYTSNIPGTLGFGSIAGDNKVKYQVTEVLPTSNKSIGSISVSEEGMMLLVKIRLANTGDETIIIEGLGVSSFRPGEMTIANTEVDASEIVALGEEAFPLVIEPNTIVEGYIPAAIRSTNEVASVYLKNNVSSININHLNTYRPTTD